MRQFLVPVAGLLLAAALAACHDSSVSQCFESNATAYPVSAPGDTTLIFRWPASYMPARVYAEPVDSTPQNVQRGMQLWMRGLRCGELALQAWADSTTADIVVRNPPSLPPSPPAAIRMGADSVGACTGVTRFQLDSAGQLIRPIRSYVSPSPATVDTAAIEACYHFVTAHELGHALGLFSHSADTGDLMNTRPRHTALSINDRYTIELLYHSDAPVKPSPR